MLDFLHASAHSGTFVHVMTRDEYERHKRRIEEQCRAGVELLESAREAQVRALDPVWMLQGQEDGGPAASAREPAVSAEGTAAPPPAAPEPLPPADRPKPRRFLETDAEVREGLLRLPETFTRRDVCEMLGYKPDRGALYRSLKALVDEGALLVNTPGSGQRATVYRKTQGSDSPGQA